ncbi:hypothetical protein TNCT_330241 [Trichonephila clavata]|uniref:Uncharacterized protein n=1 Tax=Trichonephila clavata TaxID=2740835 RepID=A0A8X6J8F0_TRICU|nr:hypothetical protein TNCT_330241 [Trichonephila clavata]
MGCEMLMLVAVNAHWIFYTIGNWAFAGAMGLSAFETIEFEGGGLEAEPVPKHFRRAFAVRLCKQAFTRQGVKQVNSPAMYHLEPSIDFISARYPCPLDGSGLGIFSSSWISPLLSLVRISSILAFFSHSLNRRQ